MNHRSAKSSHYDHDAAQYDLFNESNSKNVNETIERILREYGVQTVLDFTCGTGSQVFWLSDRGFSLVGADINKKMLAVAQHKNKQSKCKNVLLHLGDMRKSVLGSFDAVITIFNAVGHLTRVDFEKTMRNVHRNLEDNGLYIFDIFNLEYLLHRENITKLTIDWFQKNAGSTHRIIQHSTINNDGILASYTTTYGQLDKVKPTVSRSSQTLQVYTSGQLRDMLKRNGFEVLQQTAIDGTKLSRTKTERILTVARKRS